MLLQITVNNKKWKVHKNPGSLEGAWITSEELGQKLGYENPRVSINVIYNRYSENFTDKVDVADIKLISSSGTQKTRVFSERGALKIIRHSDTEIADKIMDEVFEVFLKARKEAVMREKALELFIREIPANWTKAFPDHFMEAIARLYNIQHYKPGQTCLAMASFIKTYIYACAPEGIYEEILIKNPGDVLNREFKHHQFFTKEAREWLIGQIQGTLALMKASKFDKEVFKNAHKSAYIRHRSVEDMIDDGELKLQLLFAW